MALNNPFLIEGYRSPEYFCDRQEETALLTRHVTNGCNVALIAQRRIGKSGLIHNCFHQADICKSHYTFYVDIYETKNLGEFVYELGKCVLTTLKPYGRKVWEKFLDVLTSLKAGVTFDINGNPEWNISLGDIRKPNAVLDEIFMYLASADRPCIVAIDEFQVIATYPEKTVEAALRKRIQNCHNARFIFSGSKRHMMAEIFASSARPFYNSSAIMGLEPIDRQKYLAFANRHLAAIGRHISDEAFSYLYDMYDGITWYIQYVLNILYTMPIQSDNVTADDVKEAIGGILEQQSFVYRALLFQLPAKQKQVLRAIASEDKVSGIMSQAFLRKHALTASSVQSAVKVLLERDFLTNDDDVYQLYDRFMQQWLCNRDTENGYKF